MSVPALIISMKAMVISEGQRADAQKLSAKQQTDAQRAKAETDLANETAFAQRVTVEPENAIAWILVSGGTITITNGNTVSTSVFIQVDLSGTRASSHPDGRRMTEFTAPACSHVTYRIGRHEQSKLQIIRAEEAAPGFPDFVALWNPLGQRLWSVGPTATQPLTADEERTWATWRIPFTEPATRRPFVGCV
ncbi:hypothetical protein [Nonomuraea jabiensis]|uniref:hypothetical protein n=1 Tax=Nonomuraea jabiensis TaxID=882448 RepID=UPI003D73A566